MFRSQDPAGREFEYFMGLSYVFSKGFRTAGVISESDDMSWLFADKWPWDVKLYRSALSYSSKSQKESFCLQALAAEVSKKMVPPITDDTWVVKLSGRYQVVRDALLWELLQHGESDLVARHDQPSDQIFTFFYAMKWRYMRKFLATIDFAALATKNIEKLVLEWAFSQNLVVRFLPTLFVVTNIDASGIDLF